MIHVIVACSWCNQKVDLPSSFSDTVVVSDDVTVVWHEGEPFAFCSDGCRVAAGEEFGDDA